MEKPIPTQITRLPHETQYPIVVLSRSELQRLIGMAADRLTETDIAEIAQTLAEQIEELGVWDECTFIAHCKLAEKPEYPQWRSR